MKWQKDAEKAIQKVPFFVRKRVKTRVEKEAADAGRQTVSIADVNKTRERFLNKMDKEIKGYQIDACFGSGGCPNQISSGTLMADIESLLKKENLLGFLKKQVKGGLKFHHEFRVTVSDCPNACSQPQIKDLGIIGAELPCIKDEECIHCQECVNICKEKAVVLEEKMKFPEIDYNDCVKCGQCIKTCPTKTIDTQKQGYRILLGGKLGRHPRLAEELPGIYTEKQVIEVVRHCISYYKTYSRNGERFANLLAKDNSLLNTLANKTPTQ